MSQEKFLPVLAVLLPLALFCAGSWIAHRDAERAAATRLGEITRAMQEHAERAFDANAMVLRALERTRARGAALQELVAAVRERFPHIRSITLRPDGGVDVALQPAYFKAYYARLAKPEDGVALRLASGDGRVMAEVGMLGETYSATRAVGAYPWFVSASQSPEVALAPWRHRTLVLAAIALPSAAALLYVSLLALRRARRLQEEARHRSRAEERLRHAQKMDALGQLTGGVAHDFTNLMTVISNAAHVLREKAGRESAELAAIFRAIEGGTRLTRQLLTFARRRPLDPELVELHRALPAITDLLRTTVGSGVSLGVHVSPDTPPVYLDRNELEMALINLAANARDAMERSGELEILARAAEPGEGPNRGTAYAIVSVSDSGAGIPPELLARVFEPFFTTKPAGHGTGLAQVYGFCEQAGGGVQLESDVGVGTTVSLFLPAAATMSQAVAKERRPQAARAA